MPWYKTGTVKTTINTNAIVGTGTSFIANARVGDAFKGPDGAWYEVTNIASDTALSIAPNYAGPTVASGTYAITPIQGYVKDLADQAKAMILQWGTTLTGLGSVSTENIVPITKGGTGANTAALARLSLGLGNVATENILPVLKGGTGSSTGVPVVVGATSTVAGTKGLVPAPATGDIAKFLAGDGTYKAVDLSPIAPLTARVVTLESDVDTLETNVGANTTELASLTSSIADTTDLIQALQANAITAYVTFNGTGTPVILESYGVVSVSRVAVGNYTLTFAPGILTRTTYAWSGGAMDTDANGDSLCGRPLNAEKTTTNFSFRVVNSAGSATDSAEVSILIFGGK